MDFHQLLQDQIKKHLTRELAESSEFESFLKAINDSYQVFENEKREMKTAIQEGYCELKEDSISTLYMNIRKDEGKHNNSNEEEKNNTLYISKYLSKQIRKRKETESRLTQTVELLKTLLGSLQSGILVEDENRKVLFTNQRFCTLFSIPILAENMIDRRRVPQC